MGLTVHFVNSLVGLCLQRNGFFEKCFFVTSWSQKLDRSSAKGWLVSLFRPRLLCLIKEAPGVLKVLIRQELTQEPRRVPPRALLKNAGVFQQPLEVGAWACG